VIRLPLFARVWIAGWSSLCGIFAAVFVVSAAMARIIGGVVVGLLMTALFAAWGWRLSRLAVICDAQQLVVRNLLTTRRLPRSSIHEFRLGGRTLEYPGRAVRAVLNDGSTVVLSGTGRYFARERVHKAHLAALNRWKASAEQKMDER
jgi:hypothetical protein